MEDLRGARAILTGASRGIGRTIARQLAQEGVDLVLAARSAAELESLAAELSRAHVRILPVPTDVLREEQLRALVERAGRELGGIDLLVNNAGVESTGSFELADPADLRRTVEVNLLAPLLLTRLVLPGMLERGRGHVVNVSSMAGKSGTPFNGPYSATKAGLIAFTQSLRSELRGRGVGASVVCPGFVREAGMFADSGARPPRLVGTVSPEEVAAAVVSAIREDAPEMLVMPGPVRLTGAIFDLFPRARDAFVERIGVKKVFAEMARLRART